MAMTVQEIIDEMAMRLCGKPFKEVAKHEFSWKWIEDFRERHKDWTEEDWKEYENR